MISLKNSVEYFIFYIHISYVISSNISSSPDNLNCFDFNDNGKGCFINYHCNFCNTDNLYYTNPGNYYVTNNGEIFYYYTPINNLFYNKYDNIFSKNNKATNSRHNITNKNKTYSKSKYISVKERSHQIILSSNNSKFADNMDNCLDELKLESIDFLEMSSCQELQDDSNNNKIITYDASNYLHNFKNLDLFRDFCPYYVNWQNY